MNDKQKRIEAQAQELVNRLLETDNSGGDSGASWVGKDVIFQGESEFGPTGFTRTKEDGSEEEFTNEEVQAYVGKRGKVIRVVNNVDEILTVLVKFEDGLEAVCAVDDLVMVNAPVGSRMGRS